MGHHILGICDYTKDENCIQFDDLKLSKMYLVKLDLGLGSKLDILCSLNYRESMA